MDQPPGAGASTGVVGLYGPVIRKLRGITNKTLNKEPKWRHNKDRLTSGYEPKHLQTS
jgi:hydrogenase small subunit